MVVERKEERRERGRSRARDLQVPMTLRQPSLTTPSSRARSSRWRAPEMTSSSKPAKFRGESEADGVQDEQRPHPQHPGLQRLILPKGLDDEAPSAIDGQLRVDVGEEAGLQHDQAQRGRQQGGGAPRHVRLQA